MKSLSLMIFGRLLILVMLPLSFVAHGDTVNLPYDHPRTSPNLLPNPSFAGLTPGWDSVDQTLIDGPVYDPTVSHTAGSGSIRFPAAGNADVYAQLKSVMIPNTQFKYDTPYTISYYLKALYTPAYVTATLHMYDASGNRTFSYSTGRAANSATGEWQEAVSVVTITDHSVTQIQVVIEAANSASYASDFYIDDVYFGEGISFAEQPSTTRDPFSGTNVKVDKFGAFSVYENNAWKDFFPFGLYPDLNRGNYSSLSTQGFNLVMSQQDQSQVQKAQSAVSAFNANGMRAGLRLQTYAPGTDSNWPLTLLGSTIDGINSSQSGTLLFYDWDNEGDWTSWSSWQAMVNTIRSHDVAHPIYVLNGDPAVQRLFSGLSDASGTYVGFDPTTTAPEAGVGRFEILQNLEKQTVPVSIAQINAVEETLYGFRLRVYDALIKGAKGIVWWGDARVDGTGAYDINQRAENRAWWSDVPNLRAELDALLPIIKQQYWTDWSIASSDSGIHFGTRDYNGDGYIIIMNPGSAGSSVTFTLGGRTANEVRDYLNNNSLIASVTNNQFTAFISGHSTAVYKLPAVKSQTISVTTVAPASAAYNSSFTVTATASSGLQVAITVSGGCTISGNAVTMTSATTSCIINYNQAGNSSYAAAPQVSSTTTATAQHGLTGVYYNNNSFTSPSAFTRIDTTINFNWTGSPGSGVGSDWFSVRWTGRVVPPVSGSYTFCVTADDTAKLWVNGLQTSNAGWNESCGSITLTQNVPVTIKMDYVEGILGAAAILKWSYPGQAKQVIPTSQLYAQ